MQASAGAGSKPLRVRFLDQAHSEDESPPCSETLYVRLTEICATPNDLGQLNTSTTIEIIKCTAEPDERLRMQEMIDRLEAHGPYIDRLEFLRLIEVDRNYANFQRETEFIEDHCPDQRPHVRRFSSVAPQAISLHRSPRYLKTVFSCPGDDETEEYQDYAERENVEDQAHNSRPARKKVKNFLATAAFAEDWNHRPVFIFSISMIQFIFWSYHYLHFTFHPNHQGFLPCWSIFTGPYPKCSIWTFMTNRRHEAWRFLTYIFVHQGLGHLAFNCLLQLILGLTLEATQGWATVAGIYMVGAVSGSLATSLVLPMSKLVGCSPAMMSIGGAQIANAIINWKEGQVIRLPSFSWGQNWKKWARGYLFQVLRLIAPMLLICADLAHAKFSTTNTCYASHFAGIFAGLLSGLVLIQNRRVSSWERRLKIFSMIILLCTVSVGISWNIFGNILWKHLKGEPFFPHEVYGYFPGHYGECEYPKCH